MSEKARQQKSPKQIRDPVLYEFPSPPCKELSAATMPRVSQRKIVRNWKEFKTIADWKKEFDSHPEWKGRTASQMQRDKLSCSRAFYESYLNWTRGEARGDKQLQQKLLSDIFPSVHRDWSVYRTLEDWKKKFDCHPEWRGRSIWQMLTDKNSGASTFYGAFNRWAHSEAKGDRVLKQRLMEQIFPRCYNNWSNFKSIEDWKAEFNSKPEWRGRSVSQMQQDIISGAHAFYSAFRDWARQEANGDKFLRRGLVEQIFPRRNKDWSNFKSIEDWKKEFDSHSRWKCLSTTLIVKDRVSDVRAFYEAFSKWVKLEANGDKFLRQRLMEQIFPRLTKDWSNLKSIEDWKKEFDSHPELRGLSISQIQQDKGLKVRPFYYAFSKWARQEAKGNEFLRRGLVEQIFPQRYNNWSNFKSIDDWKREFDSRQEWKGRTAVQMRRDKIAGAHVFSDAFKTWASREAKGDIGLSSALISRVMPYARNVILQDLPLLLHHISRSPNARTFQDILSSLPPNPSNQNLSQTIRIENEEFKVYHVMFNDAGNIEGRWMIHRANAPKLVAAFGGLIPNTSARDDASVLSVLED